MGCPSVKLFMTFALPDTRTASDNPRLEAKFDSIRGTSRRFSKVGLAVAATACLLLTAACTTRSEIGFASVMSEVPVTKAAVVPMPGGPSIIAVLQRSYQNGLSQEIALSTASLTPGQNAFYVTFANGSNPQSEIDDVLSLPPLSQDRIQKEMEERLPGIEMETSLVYVQNKYGPFGFATGRSANGDLCLYAWQRIEPNKPAIFVPGGTISVRLRLCDASATTEQLLRTMYGYTIAAYFMSGSWNPYGEAPPAPAQLGELDAPIHPLGLTDSERPTASRQTRVERRSLEPVSRIMDKDTVNPSPSPGEPAPTSPEVPAAPLSGYPVVPPPAP